MKILINEFATSNSWLADMNYFGLIQCPRNANPQRRYAEAGPHYPVLEVKLPLKHKRYKEIAGSDPSSTA